jgi:hypothetical protein
LRYLFNTVHSPAFGAKVFTALESTHRLVVFGPYQLALDPLQALLIRLLLSSCKKQRKPVILREIGGLSVNQQIALPVQYGALACIWRESI